MKQLLFGDLPPLNDRVCCHIVSAKFLPESLRFLSRRRMAEALATAQRLRSMGAITVDTYAIGNRYSLDIVLRGLMG